MSARWFNKEKTKFWQRKILQFLFFSFRFFYIEPCFLWFRVKLILIIHFGLVWFGLVLWHINHCSKFALFIFTRYIWFVNTSQQSYIVPCSQTIQFKIEHLFTHNRMIRKFYFKQFNLAWIKVKWFEVLLCITTISNLLTQS